MRYSENKTVKPEGVHVDFSEADVRALLDSAPDAMIIVDCDGIMRMVNGQAEVLFGYPREALIGQPIELLLPEKFRNSHVAHRTAFLEDAKLRPMGAGLELYGRRSDGKEFPVEISLSPLETAQGTLISSAIRDVTDRIAIQDALTAARDEAERANRAKSAFLAAASHDLRQPLQALMLLHAVLKRTNTDRRAAKAIESQADALGAMTTLLNSLLDISKLESGAIKPDITDCGIQKIFRRLRAEFELQAEAKGLRLLVDDCEDIVRTDPGLLEQIIQNLIANAIRYTKKGLVQLRCLHLQGKVRIEVLDTGIGIPVDELDAIFEEFYQLRREPGEQREGLGLGLSIVQRLARLLDHPLEVESKPGEGTCFAVTLPRGAGTAVDIADVDVSRTEVPSGCSVLLVDDNPAVLDATRILLELEGHKVSIAATAQEAVAVMEAAGVPDIVVADFHLGGGETGIDAIRQVRTLSGHSVPAVLVTGDTSSFIAPQIEQTERIRVFRKPVDTERLIAVIQELASR